PRIPPPRWSGCPATTLGPPRRGSGPWRTTACSSSVAASRSCPSPTGWRRSAAPWRWTAPRRGDDGAGGAAVRLVLGDDSVLLREGLARVLEDAGFAVLAQVGDADALLAGVEEHRPDVAVVDIRMPPGTDGGLRAARGRAGRRRPAGRGGRVGAGPGHRRPAGRTAPRRCQ